jgi:multiple sugar transport system ATP-binding protein
MKMRRPEIEERVTAAARMLQIEELLHRRPRQLSGGQRQRVAIGRAVVREPKIFLFDEPLSNLDAELRVQMRIELANLHQRLGNTMIYVTHDQVEAMTMADKIVVLRSGYVEQVGRPLELYNRPANRFVAGFIGSPRMNFLDGRIRSADGSGVVVEIPGLAPIAVAANGTGCQAGDPVALGVRPEHVSVNGAQGRVAEARVEATEQLGSDSYLYCELPQGQNLTIHHPGQTRIQRQDVVHIGFDTAACHLFRKSEGESVLPRMA